MAADSDTKTIKAAGFLLFLHFYFSCVLPKSGVLSHFKIKILGLSQQSAGRTSTTDLNLIS